MPPFGEQGGGKANLELAGRHIGRPSCQTQMLEPTWEEKAKKN